MKFRLPIAFAIAIGVALLLAACAGDGEKQPEVTDGPPPGKLKASDVADAVPRSEPRARYGNHSPYVVLGKTYHVSDSSHGYKKKGTASWYGSKFHGRRTSSGEPFDMYKATAAHRSLPLPTYARVTNLDDGKSVIVKINDRGPFRDSRLIDLSYGAAVRLDMAVAGTARVEVRAIDFNDPEPLPVSAGGDNGTFLQVGAFGSRDTAERLAGEMMQARLNPVTVQSGGGLYKVWIGPYASDAEADLVIAHVVELGHERPHKVRR